MRGNLVLTDDHLENTMTWVHRYQEGWNLSGRIMGSLAVSVVTFVVCGIFVLAEGVDSTLLFFCTLGLIVVSGLSTAILQVRQKPTSLSAPSRFSSAYLKCTETRKRVDRAGGGELRWHNVPLIRCLP